MLNEQIEIQKIDVPVPENTQPLLPDPNLVKAWVEAKNIPSLDRATREKLVNSYVYVTWEDFQRETEQVIDQFNALEIGSYHCYFDLVPHKSKRWMFELFGDRLDGDILTKEYVPRYPRTIDDVVSRVMETKVNNILILDDAVYTGDQVAEVFLGPLYEALFKLKKEGKDIGPVNVYLVAPYCADYTPRLFQLFWEDHPLLNVSFIYGKTLPSVGETLTEQERSKLREYDRKISFEDDDDKNLKNYPLNDNQVIATFAHKIPDYESATRSLFRIWGIDFSRRPPYKDSSTEYYKKEKSEDDARVMSQIK